MSTYRLAPTFRSTLRRRLIARFVPISIVLVGMAVVSSVAQPGPVNVLPFILPLFALLIGVSMFRVYRRALEQNESFELETTADQLIRRISGFPTHTLHRDEIVRIERHASGELTIHARDAARSFRIPIDLEDAPALQSELAQWCAIEPAAGRRAFPAWLAMIAVSAAFAVTMLAEDCAVVASVGSLLFLTLAVCAVMIWRNPQVDHRTRRLAFLTLLPAAAILARVVMALAGR